MKVRVKGFEMKFSNNVEIADVYHLIESNAKKTIEHYDDKYYLLTTLKDNYIVGLILRFKEDKSSLITQTKGGKLLVKKEKLDEDSDKTAATIFCINPESLKGLFYDHIGSVSKAFIFKLWKEANDKAKKSFIKTKELELSQLDDTKKKTALKKAKETYNGNFSAKILSTPATIDNLIDQFDVISEVTFTSSEALPGLSSSANVSRFISHDKRHTKFTNLNSNLLLIKDYVKSLWSAKKSKEDALRLRGVLESSGEDKWLYVGDNIDEFGLVTFDRYVELLPDDDWNDYLNCGALLQLLKIVKKNTVMFGHQPSSCSWRKVSAQSLVEEI